MSVAAVSWVLKATKAMPAGRRMVLIAAADYAGAHGFFWASLASLGEMAGCSDTSARRALQDAEERGWITAIAAKDPRVPEQFRVLRGDRKPRLWAFTELLAGFQDGIPSTSTGFQRGSNGVPPAGTRSIEQEQQEKDASVISDKKQDAPSKPTKAAHDAMWDTLVAVFGTPIGASTARFHDAAVSFCRAGVQPAEIGPAARRYRAAWPEVDCNPQALAKHWHKFGPQTAPPPPSVPCRWVEGTDDRGRYCVAHSHYETEPTRQV